jgi:hypothetical protein
MTSDTSIKAKRKDGKGHSSEDDQGEFPEALHRLNTSASASDKILVAGRFVQLSSSDKTFSTFEANKLLTDQGVKLTNASQAVSNAQASKRVFKVGKRFRLSQTGEDYVKQLIGD